MRGGLLGRYVGQEDESLEAALRALPGKGPTQHGDPRHPGPGVARTAWSRYTDKTAFDPNRLTSTLT
ncbi:MAG: hypothetical protein ACLPXB_03450 [Thiobacillaceae bacterium]